MIPREVRAYVEREWGAAAHSAAVTKAIGRHWQAAKDTARAVAMRDVLNRFDIADGILPGEAPLSPGARAALAVEARGGLAAVDADEGRRVLASVGGSER